MTVAELIAWLQTQDPDAEMVIHDADSYLYLELQVVDEHRSKQPRDTVAVYGDYDGVVGG